MNVIGRECVVRHYVIEGPQRVARGDQVAVLAVGVRLTSFPGAGPAYVELLGTPELPGAELAPEMGWHAAGSASPWVRAACDAFEADCPEVDE